MINFKHWQKLETQALQNMKNAYRENGLILIAVVPKGPLTKDNKPNTEFKNRLDKAVDLYNRLDSEGKRPVIIVTGSRKNSNGYTLSAVGTYYLYEQGVAEFNTFDESYNYFFSKDGVGNLEQHVDLISKLFFTYNYSELYTVCNVQQVLTLSLYFLQRNIMSKFNVTDTDVVNPVKELQTIDRLLGGNRNHRKQTMIKGNLLKWPKVTSTILNKSLLCGDEYIPRLPMK